jgi:hypothetical protein
MALYDALGVATVTEKETTSSKKSDFFFFFVFSSGCPPDLCPRFVANAPCSGIRLTCSGSNVTGL